MSRKKQNNNDDFESRLWERLMNHSYDDDYDDYDDDDDDDYDDRPPYGCRACGNPNYPKCTTSCKMFDD